MRTKKSDVSALLGTTRTWHHKPLWNSPSMTTSMCLSTTTLCKCLPTRSNKRWVSQSGMLYCLHPLRFASKRLLSVRLCVCVLPLCSSHTFPTCAHTHAHTHTHTIYLLLNNISFHFLQGEQIKALKRFQSALQQETRPKTPKSPSIDRTYLKSVQALHNLQDLNSSLLWNFMKLLEMLLQYLFIKCTQKYK